MADVEVLRRLRHEGRATEDGLQAPPVIAFGVKLNEPYGLHTRPVKVIQAPKPSRTRDKYG